MYTPLEKFLLSLPVPFMGMKVLVNPTEYELMEREARLSWEREDGVGDLIFTLRICGVVFVTVPLGKTL